jgi:hypothetical protein
VEAFLILALAAGLSAVVVWWATNLPGRRPRLKEPRSRSAPAPQQAKEQKESERFVLLPTDPVETVDDRPPPALSLVRLALIITFFAALGVGILVGLGFLVKTQLDQYFTGL